MLDSAIEIHYSGCSLEDIVDDRALSLNWPMTAETEAVTYTLSHPIKEIAVNADAAECLTLV